MHDLNDDLLLETPTPEELGLTFRVEENGDLWVTYLPTGLPVTLDAKNFPQVLLLAGLSIEDYPVDPAALSIFLDYMRRNEATEQRLGGPIDARIEIYTSPNKMLAGAIVYPAQGKGQDLNRETLHLALKQNRIVRGLLEDSLSYLTAPTTQAKIRASGHPVCSLIAYGENAYQGEDAWLETLTPDIADRRPQMDADGNINFLDLGDFPHVNADQALVRRHPPTEGKSGWTVTGHTVVGRNGKDINLKPRNATVKLAPGDDNLLLSAVAGMPVVDAKGALVEQVLRLDEVGLKTGHIHFDGSVQIKGDVNPGMKIEVSGDVKIGGLVEAAYIKAGGSIEVSGGVIGRKRSEQAQQQEAAKADEKKKTTIDDAYLEAGCTVKARFIQEAKVIAGQEIIAQTQILHSKVKAGIKIHLPGRGAIVGGLAQAQKLIDVAVSGAPANVPTRLQVGDTSALRAEMTTLNNQLKQLEIQKQQLTDLVNKIKRLRKPITEEKKQQILATRDALKEKEDAAYESLSKLEEQLGELRNSRIQVRTTCFPGSQIVIEEAEFTPRNDLGRVTFYLRDGDVNMR